MSFISLGLETIPWPASDQKATLSLDDLVRRLDAIHQTVSGITVTPENCMASPTVHAVVTAVSRRLSTLPVHVYQKTQKAGRTQKEILHKHPVEGLLKWPNDWQDSAMYWADAASYLVRYGRYVAFKKRGVTGPIRALIPLRPGDVDIRQDSSWNVTYHHTPERKDYLPRQIHYARGPARDGLKGDSPITDVQEAIALEIAAEKFGGSFFGNGAMPGLVFQFMEGHQGFRTEDERSKFVDDMHTAYGRAGRFRGMLLPKGIELGDPVGIENDKAQFLETRKYQRTVIAGALGIPPYLVGDLERQTFNNAEQQAIGFMTDVMLPMCRIFEAAMERDLLTDDDRNSGVVIRFNIDAALRGDFKTRQDGLNIQRQAGVINANDWREYENLNPISAEDGGDAYWLQGPSGQSGNVKPPAEEPSPTKPTPTGGKP